MKKITQKDKFHINNESFDLYLDIEETDYYEEYLVEEDKRDSYMYKGNYAYQFGSKEYYQMNHNYTEDRDTIIDNKYIAIRIIYGVYYCVNR